MGKIAFVFSGQGAQHPGMGQDFFNRNKLVHDLFMEADAYRNGTLEQCFTGDAAELKNTANTQPCLYLADIAAALTLEDAGIKPDAVAGFSLGEIPSLAFAGAFSYLDGFKIASKRGEVMGDETSKVSASMVAVIKLENNVVEELCKNYKHIYPVNYNSPGQLVVSVLSEELENFKYDVSIAGGKAIPLAVSGGFHSPFMDDAASKFSDYLNEINIVKPTLTAYSNFTALPYDKNVKELMVSQINHPVKWEKIISDMVSNGFDTFIEVGVGSVLQKLIKKITPSSRSFSAENYDGISFVSEELKRDA